MACRAGNEAMRRDCGMDHDAGVRAKKNPSDCPEGCGRCDLVDGVVVDRLL